MLGWVNTAINYKEEWSSRIDMLDQYDYIQNQTLCEPNLCDKYQQCRESGLKLKCEDYQVNYECE